MFWSYHYIRNLIGFERGLCQPDQACYFINDGLRFFAETESEPYKVDHSLTLPKLQNLIGLADLMLAPNL